MGVKPQLVTYGSKMIKQNKNLSAVSYRRAKAWRAGAACEAEREFISRVALGFGAEPHLDFEKVCGHVKCFYAGFIRKKTFCIGVLAGEN